MEMISFDKAYDIVINSGSKTGNEAILFTNSLGRILAEAVVANVDLPSFNKASVDGFACREADLLEDMEIIETIPAGKWPEKNIVKGQCSRIMTGAPVPDGADCVIMVEDTSLLNSGKVKFGGTFKKANISVKGEDVRKGEIVLKAGKKVRPQDIAVMAAVGHTSVKVRSMPKVAVISSGSELVEPHETPDISQIRNSNASQLIAQVKEAGASGIYYGIAADNEEQTLSVIERAVSENDIVIITGGVSMGDFDFVPSVFEQAGIKILFRRIAVQPGKPTTFGIRAGTLVFGLPGNPVSSFLQFELLVRPLICKMMDYNWQPLIQKLPVREEFKRKSSDRMALIPVRISNDGFVSPVEYHGSAHISALHEADGIISLQIGKDRIEKGEIVSVRQI